MSVSKNMLRGLGRGFDSLIPVDLIDESFDPTALQDQKLSQFLKLDIDKVVVNEDQPRRKFDEAALSELTASIAEHGVLQPIIVTPMGDKFQIVAGERRYRASCMAGLKSIPALVRTMSDQHKLEVSLIENLQRQDLNAIEVATALAKLKSQFNLSLEDVSLRVGGISASAISNKLRLLKLPDFVKQLIVDGELSEGQSRQLAVLDDKTLRQLIPKIIKESWSQHKIEQFIVNYKQQQKGLAPGQVEAVKKSDQSPYVEQLKHFEKSLNAKIQIQSNSKGAGRLTIFFKDEADLKRIESIIK